MMTDPITYEMHQHAEVWLDNAMAKRMRYRMDNLVEHEPKIKPNWIANSPEDIN